MAAGPLHVRLLHPDVLEEAMTVQEFIEVGETVIEIMSHEENVVVDVLEPGQVMRGYAHVSLTPGDAVRLSRALVAAAAEALGVSV